MKHILYDKGSLKSFVKCKFYGYALPPNEISFKFYGWIGGVTVCKIFLLTYFMSPYGPFWITVTLFPKFKPPFSLLWLVMVNYDPYGQLVTPFSPRWPPLWHLVPPSELPQIPIDHYSPRCPPFAPYSHLRAPVDPIWSYPGSCNGPPMAHCALSTCLPVAHCP